MEDRQIPSSRRKSFEHSNVAGRSLLIGNPLEAPSPVLAPLRIRRKETSNLFGRKRREAETSSAGNSGPIVVAKRTSRSATSTKNKGTPVSILNRCYMKGVMGLHASPSVLGLTPTSLGITLIQNETGSTGQTLREFKTRVQAKRKTRPQPPKDLDRPGPSKKHNRPNQKADLILDSEGLHTVRV